MTSIWNELRERRKTQAFTNLYVLIKLKVSCKSNFTFDH